MPDVWTTYGDVADAATQSKAGPWIIAGPDAIWGTMVGLGEPGAQIDVWTQETPDPS